MLAMFTSLLRRASLFYAVNEIPLSSLRFSFMLACLPAHHSHSLFLPLAILCVLYNSFRHVHITRAHIKETQHLKSIKPTEKRIITVLFVHQLLQSIFAFITLLFRSSFIVT